MNPRLRALELRLTEPVARFGMRRLFRGTAAAFESDPGDLRGLDHRALLDRYVEFTQACAERVLADEAETDRVSRRLWNEAYEMGDELRRWLGVRSRDDALRATRLAYRMIGIDLHAYRSGRVEVTQCAFASRYPPAVCRLMSCLDAGLISGLTRATRLTFSERITEGRPKCMARIVWGAAPR